MPVGGQPAAGAVSCSKGPACAKDGGSQASGTPFFLSLVLTHPGPRTPPTSFLVGIRAKESRYFNQQDLLPYTSPMGAGPAGEWTFGSGACPPSGRGQGPLWPAGALPSKGAGSGRREGRRSRPGTHGVKEKTLPGLVCSSLPITPEARPPASPVDPRRNLVS